MIRSCVVRGRGRIALTAVAALAACVSLTSSVDAGVVGHYSDKNIGTTISVPALFPAAFSFTTGTADSMTQFRLKTTNALTTTDVIIKLYQHTGPLNGNFNHNVATPIATWNFTDAPLSAGTSVWQTFDLTTGSGSPTLNANTQYVLTWDPSGPTDVNNQDGTVYGTDGWATYGGNNESGAYNANNSTTSWASRKYQWEVTFGGSCIGDLDGDGTVDSSDLTNLLGGWGGPGAGDLDGDGAIGASDLAQMLEMWGPCG